MKKYVCVLSTNNYLEGVLILNENLKFLNSKYKLLCLINENITDNSKKILDYFGIKYKIMNSIPYKTINEEHPNWSYTFDKINVVSLIEYEKIVFLDLDILILKNIDDLFERKTPCMARDYPWNEEKFSSGIMVLTPNKSDFDKMKKLVQQNDIKLNKIGDQDIYNEYYKNINELDRTYDVSRQVLNYYGLFYNDINNKIESKYMVHEFVKVDNNSKILHYCGSIKPFMLDDIFEDDYADFYNMLFKIVKNKLELFNIDENFNNYISFVPFSQINNLSKCNKYIYLYSKDNSLDNNMLKIIISKMNKYNCNFCEAIKRGNENTFWERENFLTDKNTINRIFNNENYTLYNIETKVFEKNFLLNIINNNINLTQKELIQKVIEEANKVLLLNEYIC